MSARRRWIPLTLALLACNQPERLGASAPVDPRAASVQASFEPMPLDPMVLQSHADYDAWEASVISRGGPRLAYTLYERALTNRRGNPRTFVRWVILSYREELPQDYRDTLSPFVTALSERADAAKDPDILFLLGYLSWVRLIGGAAQPEVPEVAQNGAMITQVALNWTKLLQLEAAWVGPNGVTAADLQRRLGALSPASGPTGAATVLPLPPPDSLADFHSVWMNRGPKQACERLDEALGALDSKEEAQLASLGDAYAFCAFERKNPAGALTQLDRMLNHRVDGAYTSILGRARVLSASDPQLAGQIAKVEQALVQATASDVGFARRNGLLTYPNSPGLGAP